MANNMETLRTLISFTTTLFGAELKTNMSDRLDEILTNTSVLRPPKLALISAVLDVIGEKLLTSKAVEVGAHIICGGTYFHCDPTDEGLRNVRNILADFRDDPTEYRLFAEKALLAYMNSVDETTHKDTDRIASIDEFLTIMQTRKR